MVYRSGPVPVYGTMVEEHGPEKCIKTKISTTILKESFKKKSEWHVLKARRETYRVRQ